MPLTPLRCTAAKHPRNQRYFRVAIVALTAGAALLAPATAVQGQPTLPTGSIAPYPGSRSDADIPRTREYRADLLGFVALGRVLWSSGYDQTVQSPKVWPRTTESYGRRLLTRSVQLVAIETARHGVAAVMHRDPAYVKCGCDGFGPRMGQIMKAAVTDFDMSGERRIGWPRFAGALAGSLALGQLQPDQGSAETVAIRALTTIGGSVIGNTVKEFALWERLTGSEKD